MVKHNNILPNVHLRKHWQKWVKTFFNQPGRKRARLDARRAKAAAIFPRPLQKLRPIVASCTSRYAGKPRLGRGFTLDELKEAGISPAFARTVGIAVDHRRKNRNLASKNRNIERLKAYKEKLVILPRKPEKVKSANKGVTWEDSNAKVSDQVQIAIADLFPTPIPPLRYKGGAVSAEMNKFNAKEHLKAQWADKKYRGVREKRELKAANK